MTPVVAWTRIDVRRRWASLLLLGVLVALASSAVLAAATAAHRGSTALARLDAGARPATVRIPNFDARVDLGAVATLPYVDAVARVAGGGIGLLDDGHQGSSEQLTPVDGVLFDRIERPIVVAGRMFDRGAPDEAVVTPLWARTFGRGVGDTATVRLPTPRQQATGTEDVPRGPEVALRIVGIVKAPAYLDWPGQHGWFIPSPGFAAAYRANWDTSLTRPGCVCQWASVGAFVRLDHGVDDIGRLRSDLARLFPDHTFNLVNLVDNDRVHQHDIAVQSWGLLAFAAAALVASVLLVSQAAARHVGAGREMLRTSGAVGFTTRELVVAATLGPALAATLGALLGAAVAVVSSRWTPLGVARVAEPSDGTSFDGLILVPGVLLAVGVVVTAAALATRRALRPAERHRKSQRRSAVATWAARVGLPLPLQVGARFALEPGRSVPVVQTVVAVVVAVAGSSAALLIDTGVRDALTHPERFGQTFQSVSFAGFGSTDFFDPQQIADAVTPVDYVDGFALSRQSSAGADGDRVGVSLFSYAAGAPKPLAKVVLDGRLPRSPDEVALAPSTLDSLDASIGDTIRFDGDKGSSSLLVVGRVLMPATDNNRYDQGGWVTEAAYDRLFAGFDAHWVLVSSDPSAGSGAALNRRLTADVAPGIRPGWARSAGFDDMGTAGLTTEPLRQVRWFPMALGVLVGLLAVAAVAHSGAVAVRRRSGELANLRALGMTRAGAGAAMIAQGGVLGVVGLLLGLPLGAAVGRSLWRLLATSLPLQLVPPGLGQIWLIVPGALALLLLLTLVPVVRVARMPIAAALRAE